MDSGRRRWLACLGAAMISVAAVATGALAQEAAPRVIEVRIEKRQVVEPEEAIRITQGETVELRWTSDEASEIHLHGYDIELQVEPGEPATMAVEAFAAGRFPITSHGWGGGHSDGGDSEGGHHALTYLEVYPE